MSIGTLNEGPLHQALKSLYTAEDAVQEVSVGSYVADVRGADDVLYEIQTGGFANLKKKLGTLVEQHRVVLVHPIAKVRYIVKLPVGEDEEATRRRSPKRGCIADIVSELVSIPQLLNHPNFELEVVLIEEDEFRVFEPKKVRGRRGWRVVQRRLVEVLEKHRFCSAADLFCLVPGELPDTFTTLDLAEAMQQPRWMAQKLAYCLREAGEITLCGKEGNALCYAMSKGADSL
ncbi:MAG: hypothetical protein O7G86_07090 [Gammaproteobacteria bacterium]|nr:hypothetical protein [Gammaproteobacteria bacterium]